MMMHLWRARFLVLPLFSIAMSGASVIACSGSVEPPPGDGDGDGDNQDPTLEETLEGRTFVLESVEGYSPVADTTPSVSFQSGQMGFSAGCNGHHSEISFEGDVLVVDGFGSTDIGCEQPLHEQDMWFAAYFSDRPVLTIAGDRITFTTDEATLVFVDDEVVNPPAPLVGPVWEVWTLTDSGTATGGFDVVPTVMFGADGTVHVFSGCNNGEGSYNVVDGTIHFDGGIGYSEAGCPDEISADIESHMQAIFTAGVVAYSFNRQDLVIDKGDIGVRASQEQ